jgi:hypothetical protein
MLKKSIIISILLSLSLCVNAAYILIPMDNIQKNHLKAYGLTYWVLQHDVECSWLLNYRGGSFMFKFNELFEKELKIRGISYQIIADVQSTAILQQIADPEANMDEVKLHKAPKIAVY